MLEDFNTKKIQLYNTCRDITQESMFRQKVSFEGSDMCTNIYSVI